MVSMRSAGTSSNKRKRGHDEGESQTASTSASAISGSEDATGAGTSRDIRVMENLSTMQRDMKHLLSELKSLRRENIRLKDQLEQAEDSNIQPKPGRRGGQSNAALTAQININQLKVEIEELKEDRQKGRRKIRKLEEKEIKKEVDDLEDDQRSVVGGDETHQMRKLLRRFQDLMLVVVLEENEECLICLDKMELKSCSSLPCQHIFCDDCLKSLIKASKTDPDEEVIRCPTCRKECSRDDLELVHFTPLQRWDELLEVAKGVCKIRYGELATSEEEDEENFIDDGKTDSSSAPSAPATEPDEPGAHDVSSETETTPTRPSYRNATSPEKKERLLRLAEQRSRKQR